MVICVICGNAVGSSLRRVLHPPSCEGTRAVRDFYVAHVHSFAFDVSGTKQIYVCKKPCFAKLEQALKHLTKANASIVELKAMLPIPSTVTPSMSGCSIRSLMNVVEAGTQTNDRRCDASVQTNATDVIVTTPRRKRLHPDSQVEVPTSPRSTSKRPRVTTRGYGTKRGLTEPSRGAPASKRRRFQPQTPPASQHPMTQSSVVKVSDIMIIYSMHVLIVLHFD